MRARPGSRATAYPAVPSRAARNTNAPTEAADWGVTRAAYMPLVASCCSDRARAGPRRPAVAFWRPSEVRVQVPVTGMGSGTGVAAGVAPAALGAACAAGRMPPRGSRVAAVPPASRRVRRDTLMAAPEGEQGRVAHGPGGTSTPRAAAVRT